MQKQNSRKRKSLRKNLLNSGVTSCFYCGLPFHAFILAQGTPGAAKSRRYSFITLEHLQAVSKNGETIQENCVLAHLWCNSTAANLSLEDKLVLKERLSINDGIPPWWPIIQKIIAKQTL
jgi:5-methylcytosine-specific restriction endonuclease McrA